VKECLPEFGTGDHKHNRIVNAVQHENIPHVRPNEQNVITITFQPDAPVQSDGVTGNWESTQGKWQNVERHDQRGLNFKFADF
jgi:hypothetical protein